MAKYVFGVDIGGTTVKIGLFTAEGTMVDKWEITTRTDEGGKYILGDIAASIEDKLAEKQIDKSEVKGIGMGVPGPVKMWQGGGKGFSNIVMVTLGTGVGGGIILGGKMLSGVNGAGGEIGHIQVNDDETEVCGCGRKGCLEQYTSATGIVRMANTLLNTTDSPSALRNVQYVSAKEVFDAAKQGDELAAEIVDRHGKCLGKALAQIACVVDPEVFVIGGGVSKAGTIITDTTEKYFKEYAFHACKNTKFTLATLGNDAGMYGGACAIMND